MVRAKRKNPNRAGTDARKRKDGRYETRATLDTPTGRRRVSFNGATAEEANTGELAALWWEDVELGDSSGKAEITVRRSADTRIKVRVSTTKTGQERRVGIGPRTVATLNAHLGRQRKERMAARSWADPGLVFPSTRGTIRRHESVRRSLKRLLKEAGLPSDVRFHDLRHTAATLAIRQGQPIPVVSKMLGHADPAMTLRRYAHVLDDMREDAARAMDDLF